MGKDVKKRFTVSLDIDTKDAEKQIKSTVGNLKTILADLGNASDKMSYFKELVNYIQQIDTALTAFKNKNKDAFNNMFDGLDSNLKQVMENIFETSSKSVSALDELRNKINSAAENGAGVKELRSIAEDINDLFVNANKLPPIDIEDKFTGRGNAKERISMLKEALDNFATVWDGVNNKIKNGFSFGGSGGSGNNPITKLTDSAQKQVNVLEEKIRNLQSLIVGLNKSFSNIKAFNDGDDMELDFDATEESANNLLDTINQLSFIKQKYDTGQITTEEDYQNLIKYVQAAEQLVAVYTEMQNQGMSSKALRERFSDSGVEDFISNIDKNFVNSISNSLNKILTDAKNRITAIKADDNNYIKSETSTDDIIKDNNKIVLSYDELSNKLDEYIKLQEKANSNMLTDDNGKKIEEEIRELENYFDTLGKTREELDKIQNIISNFSFGDIDKNEAIKQMSEFLTIVKQIKSSDFTENSGTGDNNTLGKMVSEIEYVQGIAIQLEKLFNNINTMSGTLEYRILVNGQEIDIKQGSNKSISEQTIMESFLGTLNKKTLAAGHNHPGGTSSNYNQYDLRSDIEDIYSGVSAMGMIVGERDITTLNLATVKLEDALSVLKQIEALNLNSVPSEKINELFQAINPEYTNIAQTWDPSQFNDLAKYIYNVGESANVAVDPLEKFKNILKLATDGNIDLSKYQDFFDNFKIEDAGSIFNQIMSMEGKDLKVVDTSVSSLSEFIAVIKHQQEALVQLRNEADVTYSDIHDMVQRYLNEIKSNSGYGEEASQFIKQYFGRDDQRVVADWLLELENGESSVLQITNRIAGYFKNIDPSEYLTDSSIAIEQAKTKLQEFLALADEIRNKSFDDSWDATDNVEIGKYTERLNAAKAALDALGDQGQLTAEQLEQVNNAFDAATKDLSVRTKTYDAYASDSSSTYDYYNEYEMERDKANQLEQENADLREQLSKKQQTIETQPQYDQSSEMAQLSALQDKLIEVKAAVERKTQAFKDEVDVVGTGVDIELAGLNQLLEVLIKIIEQINLIKEGFASINGEVAELNAAQDTNVNRNIPAEVINEKAKEVISQDYALDSTLVETNGILNNILTAIGNNESIKGLVDPLTSAVAELKNVANGIIEHQKAQRTDLTDSSTRIANNYGQLSSITGNAVAGLGGEVQIENMKALADNIVRVKGAVQNADGVWKGFVVDIDESNKAVVRAVDEQSTFAKSLNESAEAAKKVKENVTKTEDNQFTKSLNNQITFFDKYKEKLKDVSYISDDLKTKLDELGTSLRQVTDTDGLNAWKDSFSEVQKQITLAEKTFIAQQTGKVNQAQKVLDDSFKKTGLKETDTNVTDEQQKIIDGYKQANAVLTAYNILAQKGNQIEASTLQNVTSELYKQIEAYKQRNNIVDGSKKTYGTNAVATATAKYNSLSQVAKGDFSDSVVVQKALNDYTAAYQRFINKQKEYKAGQKLDTNQEAEFKQLQTACNDYAKELNKLITASKKFAESADNVTSVDEDFEDSILGRQKALQDYIQVQYGASAKIGEFDSKFEKLTFTIDNGNGTFTQMTAAINPARNAIGAITGDTEKATTAFGQFINEVKGKFKTISAYLISSFSLQEIWQQFRQGIGYVKEIDSALTELKKVTDETDATYKNFLQTASKTASTIGSTVADFTNATADFARLGYDLEQASSLAEAASVYKNVGDGIEDVSQASESIISTMKAFGIEAENAMGIVDRFNEVGNNFAISSTGIGEAMQRSASALYEAGNTIDESVALITAANSVIQNPEQVGTALKTLALRLRGTKTELEDAGLETDNMAESVSQLQAKLKALTHGKVDIMVNADTFKNTTEILREMSAAWQDMTDLERASALELMGGKRQAKLTNCLSVQKCA